MKLDTAKQREMIENGLRKAIAQMMKKAALLDEEVVISRDGKVLKIKAKELIKS
jgi:hypothetical protein